MASRLMLGGRREILGTVVRCLVAGCLGSCAALCTLASAQANPPATPPAGERSAPAVVGGTSAAQTRQEAIDSIPMDKLDRQAQAKIRNVLANVTIYRRLPVRVVDCDPELYLLLVRHPDVVVNIWETLKLTQLQVRQTAADTFRAVESDGTTVNFEYLYKSHDTHIVLADGTYTGSILNRTVKGSALVILKSGFVRETDGRYYVTNRMDAFLNVEPGAIEIVTKTLQPIASRIADNNFTQSVAFLGSLSKTAEVNPDGMQRLAAKLENVQPEVRRDLAEISLKVAEKAKTAAREAERRQQTPLAVGRSGYQQR